MKTYKDYLQMDKEEIEQTIIDEKVDGAKLEIDNSIFETKKKINALAKEKFKAKSAYPFSSQRLYEIDCAEKIAKSKLAFLTELKQELFGE